MARHRGELAPTNAAGPALNPTGDRSHWSLSMQPESPRDPPLRTLHLGDGPIAYCEEGDGVPVIAIHGAPGSVRDFRWLASCLGADVRFIRVDLPGFGQTPLSTLPSAGFDSRSALMMRFADALGLDRFVVLGHSVGGALAMQIAADAPDRVAGLALLGSMGLRPHRPFRENPSAGRISAWLRLPIAGHLLTHLVRKGFERTGFPRGMSATSVRQTMALVAEIDFERQNRNVERLQMSTLVAWTEDDRLIEADVSAELAVACPDGPRLSFESGGHNLQKTRAVETGSALQDWLPSLQMTSTPRRPHRRVV